MNMTKSTGRRARKKIASNKVTMPPRRNGERKKRNTRNVADGIWLCFSVLSVRVRFFFAGHKTERFVSIPWRTRRYRRFVGIISMLKRAPDDTPHQAITAHGPGSLSIHSQHRCPARARTHRPHRMRCKGQQQQILATEQMMRKKSVGNLGDVNKGGHRSVDKFCAHKASANREAYWVC